MSSEESSDDEPLSVLAAAKQKNPEQFISEWKSETEIVPVRSRKKKKPFALKKQPITIKLSSLAREAAVTVVQRPTDVWLYLKDLNPFGPFSCLICSDWFISRGKVIMHYVLNHKKDFCGVCRYFVPDREAWRQHLKFHSPWPCSQCTENFDTESELRVHLNNMHNLVHCQLCHFRVQADQYDSHLFQKHNVTSVTNKNADVPWKVEEGSKKFLCFLCTKSDILTTEFVNHFMGNHHFTLKCFANIVSGYDRPFSVPGVAVSQNFLDSLKDQRKYGYVDLDKSLGIDTRQQNSTDNYVLNSVEIKQENYSDGEGEKSNADKTDDNFDESNEFDREGNKLDESEIQRQMDIIKAYKGDEDFDVTMMEVLTIEKCYYDYINATLSDINSKIMPENSKIGYDKGIVLREIVCLLCDSKLNTAQEFTNHMQRIHSVKCVPVYFCRVCATTFDNKQELDTHTAEELGEFEDLWICQFCDKEFDNREATRRHITDHWDSVEYDNCFSPHLGFKCRYCPTLFWNETHRENHQVKAHYQKFKEQYYRCSCSELYSDKVWFMHHYLEKHPEKSDGVYLLKCNICCTVLESIGEMRNHFSMEHPDAKKIFCSLDGCQYRPLSHKKSFQLHLRSQHTTFAMNRSCSCAKCGQEFANPRARSVHVSRAHGTGKYRCKICGDMLQSVDERKLHYLIAHPGHHPYSCAECGKSFQYKSSLYIHKQQHAPNKQNYTCSYCQKVFAKKDSFREHLQIHEGPRHACSYCPMRFVQRSNMLRHERRHTGERPYACPHCPRTFADKGACNSHTRTHSGSSSFACVYCSKTFVQKSKLTYHIRKHTGENLEKCTVCAKVYTSACSLREHMKTHLTKLLTIKCPLCDRKYQDEKNMLRHLRTAHTGEQYNCPICNKDLTSTAGLRMHVLTHSNTNVFKCKLCKKTYAVQRSMLKHMRKRHSLKSNLKDYFTVLDPRECQLNLDEEVITQIFGPPRDKNVSFSKVFSDMKLEKEDNEASESGTEEGDNTEEQELEPTDFVTVKIEPLDDEEYC